MNILSDKFFKPDIQMIVLPGCKKPARQSDGAIGYDAYARAIVSPFAMDEKNPRLRETIYDFNKRPADPEVAAHLFKVKIEKNGGSKPVKVYRLYPQERVLIGLGFMTAMPFPLFYWVAPRSGLASKYGITVGNAPGTIDPDYRGEAGVILVNNGQEPFDLYKNQRIVQVIFQWAIIPNIKITAALPETVRGVGGFGSTGM